ncbi:hypothetical protein ALC56_07806 [Trachymyrmex septentrionalis]|uniref:Uncharacterized protein n=1 Tax=Trachymyrmex septentrionalis TaxID=34720 RepID=A0A195FBL8_9HYME|nr:hypothetical protein ALC56_07806 [Trachymyrmex septentrionalis]
MSCSSSSVSSSSSTSSSSVSSSSVSYSVSLCSLSSTSISSSSSLSFSSSFSVRSISLSFSVSSPSFSTAFSSTLAVSSIAASLFVAGLRIGMLHGSIKFGSNVKASSLSLSKFNSSRKFEEFGRYGLIRLIEIFYKINVKYRYIIFRLRIVGRVTTGILCLVPRRTTIVTPQNRAPATARESIGLYLRLVSLLAAMGSAATYLAYLDPLVHRFEPKLFPTDYCSTTNPCRWMPLLERVSEIENGCIFKLDCDGN